jgi:hypothetical protein
METNIPLLIFGIILIILGIGLFIFGIKFFKKVKEFLNFSKIIEEIIEEGL